MTCCGVDARTRTAKKFASSGHAVGMIGRQQDRLDACRAAILEEVPSAKILGAAADVTDADQCAQAFATLQAAHGDPDCLCYNISSRPFPPTPVGEMDPSRLESDWKTGPYAALLCVQQVLPAMRAAGTGAILFTGASASLRGSAKFGSFAVNKCGLRALAPPAVLRAASLECSGRLGLPSLFPTAGRGRRVPR